MKNLFLLVILLGGSIYGYSLHSGHEVALRQTSEVKVLGVTKVKSPRDIIFSYKNGDTLWKIYGLESSWGKNDGCRSQGKFNGFGFRQNSLEHMCYGSFEEVTGLVDKWLTERSEENICLYNKGIRTTKCDYLANFKAL